MLIIVCGKDMQPIAYYNMRHLMWKRELCRVANVIQKCIGKHIRLHGLLSLNTFSHVFHVYEYLGLLC